MNSDRYVSAGNMRVFAASSYSGGRISSVCRRGECREIAEGDTFSTVSTVQCPLYFKYFTFVHSAPAGQQIPLGDICKGVSQTTFGLINYVKEKHAAYQERRDTEALMQFEW